MPRVLLASSIGPGKECYLTLLHSVIRQLEGAADALVTLDGLSLGKHQREPGIFYRALREPETELSIHGRLARMRESQRRFFLEGDWTHLYWHDSDMIPPFDIIPRLLAHGAPVASGLYNRRGDTDLCLCVFARFGMREGEELGDVATDEVELDARGCAVMAGAGTGCLLISREILERFPLRAPEWYPREGPGEDVRWCMDLNEAGIGVLVDWTLPCWHVNEDGTATRPALNLETLNAAG